MRGGRRPRRGAGRTEAGEGGSGPIRTCLGCRRRRGQGELVAIALGPDGALRWAPTSQGRRAYVCPLPGCLRGACQANAWARAFRRPVPALDAGRLLELLRASAEATTAVDRVTKRKVLGAFSMMAGEGAGVRTDERAPPSPPASRGRTLGTARPEPGETNRA